MQVAAVSSFVEASFFTQLSDKKLNEFRLTETCRPLHATYTVPPGRAKLPSITLDHTAFEPAAPQLAINHTPLTCPGSLLNFNTIEAFRALDHAQTLREEGQALCRAIVDGTALANPSELTRFLLTCFSDLKKYKFSYWFAFPSVVPDWSVSATRPCGDDIDPALAQFQSEAPGNQWGFFLLRQDESGWVAGPLADYKTFWPPGQVPTVGIQDPCSVPDVAGWYVRNFVALLGTLGLDDVQILLKRAPSVGSVWLDCHISTDLRAHAASDFASVKISGWERNRDNRLVAKTTDLAPLISPERLADQAVDLNLKLMKWRLAPELDLDAIKNTRCLLLGAGTLGSYIARALLGWGVRKITFVDSGRVSFSNPVRQSLYTFADCVDGGAIKAERAAEALHQIYPSIDSTGHQLEIPMLGHPLTDEVRQHADYDRLDRLMDEHDTVFLLMDSRESRWLPSVMAAAKRKLTLTVALGFDTFIVMRHGLSGPGEYAPALGCYFCNDVVAPVDSVSNQTLDQMCTVTRPGVSMFASSLAVELLTSVLQHPLGGLAPPDDHSTLSDTPHQIRGFLHDFNFMKIWGPSYPHCSACSTPVVEAYEQHGWEFVSRSLNDPDYIEELSGLAEIKRQAENADVWSDGED